MAHLKEKIARLECDDARSRRCDVDAGFSPDQPMSGYRLDSRLRSPRLELLKQIAPGITRAAVLRDPTISALIGQFAAIQGAAPSFGVEVTPIDVRDGEELQRAVAGFLRGPNDGLIVSVDLVQMRSAT